MVPFVSLDNVTGGSRHPTSLGPRGLCSFMADELPHEVILAINQVLDLNKHKDPFDLTSEHFNTVDVLNELFPNGAQLGT